jgi:hypothetical protein
MKKLLQISILLSLCFPHICSQTISQKDNSFIDSLFRSKLVIEKKKVVSDTLAMVFKGNFYLIAPKINMDVDEMIYMCEELININDGVLCDSRYTGLFSILKENISLKSEKDIIIFESALDKLYPVSDYSKKHKMHMKSGNIWYFIRGDFFGTKHGFKVSIDQTSKITGIDYDDEAIKAK